MLVDTRINILFSIIDFIVDRDIFCHQVSFILNAWRATQSDQQRIGKTLIEILKDRQIGGDCNRLITDLQQSAYTKEKSLGKITTTISN